MGYTPTKHVHKQLFFYFEHSITLSENPSRKGYPVLMIIVMTINIESDQEDLDDTTFYSDNVMTGDVSDSDDLPYR